MKIEMTGSSQHGFAKAVQGAATLLTGALLAACGGGGGDDAGAGNPPPAANFTSVASHTRLDLAPSQADPLRYTMRADLQAFDVSSNTVATVTALRTPAISLVAPGTSTVLGTQRHVLRSITCTPGGAAASYDALMLFDRSGSMASNDPANRSLDAGSAFADRLGPGDRAQVAEFSGSRGAAGNVRFLTAAFSNDPALIRGAIGSVRAASGDTPLWDAMLQSLDRFAGSQAQRALLTFSDGEDTASQNTPAMVQAKALAAGSNVAIYAINLRNSNTAPLDNLALATGGAVFSTDEAQQLVQYYQVLGLLLSRRATTCTVEIDVSFEPVAGAGEIGYGPAQGVRPAIGFDVSSAAGASTVNWQPDLALYPGRRIGTSNTARSIFETDLSTTAAANGCIDNTAAAPKNICSMPVSVAVCSDSNCVSDIVEAGQAVPLPTGGVYNFVACSWQPPVRTFHPAQMAGGFPSATFQRWQQRGQNYHCVNSARF